MENATKVTEEIIGLEKKYWQAMKDLDLETALSLTDFPCIVAGEHGMRSVSKEEYEKMFNSGQGGIKEFKFDESNAQVRLVGPDTAVIAYQVNTKFNKDGKIHACNAVDTSTWIRRNGKWTCAMHTETELAPAGPKQ